MKRLLTALVCIPIALLAVFRLPGGWFLLGVVALLELAVLEYIKIGEHWAPGGVLRSLLVLVPVTTLLLPVASCRRILAVSSRHSCGWRCF